MVCIHVKPHPHVYLVDPRWSHNPLGISVTCGVGGITFLICSFGRSGFTKWFPFFSIAYRQPSRNEVQINDKNSKLEKFGKNIENFIKKI